VRHHNTFASILHPSLILQVSVVVRHAIARSDLCTEPRILQSSLQVLFHWYILFENLFSLKLLVEPLAFKVVCDLAVMSEIDDSALLGNKEEQV